MLSLTPSAQPNIEINPITDVVEHPNIMMAYAATIMLCVAIINTGMDNAQPTKRPLNADDANAWKNQILVIEILHAVINHFLTSSGIP